MKQRICKHCSEPIAFFKGKWWHIISEIERNGVVIEYTLNDTVIDSQFNPLCTKPDSGGKI